MTQYKHTQSGKLIRWTMTGVAVMFVVVMTLTKIWTAPIGIQLIPLAALIGLMVCWYLFDSLTVEITETKMFVRFGPGLIKKIFELKDIRGARAVRNKWWYGWGIRLTPHGWLYNVSGLDAVEIDLRDKKKFRIGTDRPHELLSAIQSATGRT